MENIKFSGGLTLEDFDKPRHNIGQFNPEDRKLLRKLVKTGVLIQFKQQWYPNIGRPRDTWVKSDSPEIGKSIFFNT